MSNQIQLLAHSLAARIPAMVQDCPLNNSRVIEEEIREAVDGEIQMLRNQNAALVQTLETRASLEFEHIMEIERSFEPYKRQLCAMKEVLIRCNKMLTFQPIRADIIAALKEPEPSANENRAQMP